ncbi:MAG: OmpA family protein [Bacteroidales bacterium]
MRKLLFISLLTVFSAGAFAQSKAPEVKIEENVNKYAVLQNRFRDNFFITTGIGGQMYIGDHNKQLSLGERATPLLEIGFGKWFNPGFGVRALYSGNVLKGATQNGSYSTGKPVDAKDVFIDYQKFHYGHLQFDALIDLSYLCYGYNPKRVYSAVPYVGVGLLHITDTPRKKEFGMTFGFMSAFRLSSAFDLNLDLRSTLVNDAFDGEMGGRKKEALLSGSVGVTYKFKQRGWKRAQNKVLTYHYDDELNAVSAKLSAAEKRKAALALENDSLKKKKRPAPVVVPVQKETVHTTDTIFKRDVIVPRQLIVFELGKSTLSKDARVTLGFYSNSLKNNQDRHYTITGFADRSTGTDAINERLSRARAQAVYDCLVHEFHVPASILSVHSMGGVDDMFYNDPAMSRAVLINQQ